MFQQRALIAAEKLELLELLYRRLPCGGRVKPGTKALLLLLADCRSALHWSNARIAETLGYSVRTISRAMVELRSLGILHTVRRRRQTSERSLDLSAAHALMSQSVESIKRICKTAVAALRGNLEVTQRARSNHFCLKAAPALPSVAAVSDLSPQLRRLMLGG